MAFQLSTATRNNVVLAVVNAIGGTATFTIFSGAEPVDCSAIDPTGPLVVITLPALPFNPVGGGNVDIGASAWTGTASANGTAQSFRIKVGATCILQGSCSGLAGSGDLKMSSASMLISDTINITSFNLTAGNA